MKRLTSFTMIHARSLACVCALSALGCSSGGETVPVAGSWASLTAESDEPTWAPRRDATTGTSVWLEPLDLSTGLEPNRLQLGIGLHNPERAIESDEAQTAAESAELVRWPGGSLIPAKVEVEEQDPYESVRQSNVHRARVRVLPDEPLKPGWYALTTGPDGLVSRFHVGSCPILIGLSWCDGMDGLAVVFSEPVARDADVHVLSEANGKKCSHDPLRFENRTQNRSMRRYVRCDLDPRKDVARVQVGNVPARAGKKLRVPASSRAYGVSALDIRPQNYTKVGRCSHARVPLKAPLPRCR